MFIDPHMLEVGLPRNDRSRVLNSPEIKIARIIRRMAGSCQSRLVEAEDGNHYVVKFLRNPLGPRAMINTWIAYRALARLRICTPETRVMTLTDKVCSATDDLSFHGSDGLIEPGLHLGSKCPVNPTTEAMFDFLPRKLTSRVVNPYDFAKVGVLDLLLGYKGTRQAVFIKKPRSTFCAYLIGHSRIFCGAEWQFQDVVLSNSYDFRSVYETVPEMVWLSAIRDVRCLTQDDFFHAVGELPSQWFSDRDYDVVANLLLSIPTRQNILEDLVQRKLASLGKRLGDSSRCLDAETMAPPYAPPCPA